MKRHMLAATTVVALLFLLTLSASHASAAMLTFQLTSDHCGGTNGCIPVDGASAGTVTITDGIAGVVNVSVALNTGYQLINSGFDASFGFNLSGDPSITYSNIVTAANFTIPGGNPQSKQSLHMDGTGFFEYGLDGIGSGGSDPLGSSLTFTLTAAGLSTGSFEKNTDLQYFAVDVIGPNGNTGGVDASTVPDGGMTLMLLGGALVGLESLRRRFRV
jgi:hypothetical protein